MKIIKLYKGVIRNIYIILMAKFNQEKYRKWLNYNCKQTNNWIVWSSFKEIVGHANCQYFIDDQPSSETINFPGHPDHVYFTSLTPNQLITLVEVSQCYYLINNQINISSEDAEDTEDTVDNSQTAVIPPTTFPGMTDDLIQAQTDKPEVPSMSLVSSRIYRLTDLKKLVTILTGREKDRLALPGSNFRLSKWEECSLPKNTVEYFMGMTDAQIIERLASICKSSSTAKAKSTIESLLGQETTGNRHRHRPTAPVFLDLTHNYIVKSDHLTKVGMCSEIEQIIINQNIQITDLEWLTNFPNLKIIDIVNHQGIENSHLEVLSKLKKLEVVNIHNCCQLSIRVFLALFKIPNLKKLMIDWEVFPCQKGYKELYIHPHEWKQASAPLLENLYINSSNLNLDIIDYILTSCPHLKSFIVNDDLLSDIEKKVKESFEPREIVFLSAINPRRGLSFRHRPKFVGMYKDSYGQGMFSKSMLEVIRKQRESAQALADVPEAPEEGAPDA